MKRLVRVFPSRTSATPDDPLAYVGYPDLFSEADEVHVSVAFSWDLPKAEKLAKAWSRLAPTTIGGPALGMRGEEFTPGRYMKLGYTITSRGCRNRCWFCSVWKRDGNVRELPIHDGWIVNDDNLLACSEPHIRAVVEMLRRQPHRADFRGGLEAALLKDWHVNLLASLSPKPVIWCAYDTPDDLEPLQHAGKLLLNAGFSTSSHRLRAYVLIGQPNDSPAKAELRLTQTLNAGFTPFAMLYREEKISNQREERRQDWKDLQRKWARPAIIHAGNQAGKRSPETEI